MFPIIIAEAHDDNVLALETIFSDCGFTAGTDFKFVASFRDAINHLATSEDADGPQLLIFGTSPAEVSSVEQTLRDARQKNRSVSIMGLFAPLASAAVDLHIPALRGLAYDPDRSSIKTALGNFRRHGRIVM